MDFFIQRLGIIAATSKLLYSLKKPLPQTNNNPALRW